MTAIGLDHPVIAVADLESATLAYSGLLGREPSWRGAHPALGSENTLFRLGNSYLELLAACGDGPLAPILGEALGDREERFFALALGAADVDAAVERARAAGLQVSDPAPGAGSGNGGIERTWRSAFIDPAGVKGLRLFFIQHTSAPELLPPARAAAEPGATADAVDHVVVFCQDIDLSRDIWVRALGLRQIWRREFRERGTRNLGLDLGGVLLELIQRIDRPAADRPDTLWGLAYRVGNCGKAVLHRCRSGLSVDEPRDGLASGTRVATVRWRRTPTLFIEAAASGSSDPGVAGLDP